MMKGSSPTTRIVCCTVCGARRSAPGADDPLVFVAELKPGPALRDVEDLLGTGVDVGHGLEAGLPGPQDNPERRGADERPAPGWRSTLATDLVG